MKPWLDSASTKYPDRTFYGGAWMTREQIEQSKTRRRQYLSPYRAVSTAEKRALLEAAGEEWPKYPDGSSQLWQASPRLIAGGYWISFPRVKRKRATTLSIMNTRYQDDPQYRKQRLAIEAKKRQDPQFRKQKTIYMVFYSYRKKENRYVQQGLIDHRLTLRDNGQKASSSRSGVVA